MKDSACIKEHVKGMAMMKLMITKEQEGVISEMEKLLMVWMQVHIQKYIPLSLMMI